MNSLIEVLQFDHSSMRISRIARRRQVNDNVEISANERSCLNLLNKLSRPILKSTESMESDDENESRF